MAKTKTSKPAVTNKASLTGALPIRPVKETLTKTALINLVAEQTIFRARPQHRFTRHWKGCFSAQFIRAALASSPCQDFRRYLSQSAGSKGGISIRNPATGEMIKGAAKPASVRVNIRALSKLKTAAASRVRSTPNSNCYEFAECHGLIV